MTELKNHDIVIAVLDQYYDVFESSSFPYVTDGKHTKTTVLWTPQSPHVTLSRVNGSSLSQGLHCGKTPQYSVCYRKFNSYCGVLLCWCSKPHQSFIQFVSAEQIPLLLKINLTKYFDYYLQIVESRVRFRYRLSDSDKTDLRISTVQINDGQWHYVKVNS